MFCFIYRLLISNAQDQDRSAGPRVQAHCLRCPSCRKHLTAIEELARRLRQPQPVNDSDYDDAFNQRIISALGHRPVSPVTLPSSPWIIRQPAIAAAIVGLLILLGSLFVISQRQPQLTPSESIALVKAEFTEFLAPEGSPLANAVAWQQTHHWSELVETPMNQELDHLIADTNTAANSLLACLPFKIGQTAQN